MQEIRAIAMSGDGEHGAAPHEKKSTATETRQTGALPTLSPVFGD